MMNNAEDVNKEDTIASTPEPVVVLPVAAQLVTATRDEVKRVCEGGIDSSMFDDAVVQLATVVVEERVSLLVKGHAKYIEAKKAYEKINKVDQISYGPDRKPVSESYSKDRLDAIEKASKALDRIEKAYEKAVNSLDFSDLKNLVG